MKTKIKTLRLGLIRPMIPLVLLPFVLSVSFQSCQKEENLAIQEENVLKAGNALENPTPYWGNEQFMVTKGKAIITTRTIGSADLDAFENCFSLNIQNGDGINNMVSYAVIKIDGVQIVGQKDFKKNPAIITKEICNLTAQSNIEIQVSGKAGNYIGVWIEGILKPNKFKDLRDGKIYKTVIIGTQTWLAENLAYETLTGSWAYNNDAVNMHEYGLLYDWPAAMNACPVGWHLPSDAEWTILTTYIGGESVAGGKMKEAGTSHWYSPNTGATNESGFSGLPGGFRRFDGAFINLGYLGYWWSSTEVSETPTVVWLRYLHYYDSRVIIGNGDKEYGWSVRCVRN
jgi:uncharacterized protein (TIGR02145 family)